MHIRIFDTDVMTGYVLSVLRMTWKLMISEIIMMAMLSFIRYVEHVGVAVCSLHARGTYEISFTRTRK